MRLDNLDNGPFAFYNSMIFLFSYTSTLPWLWSLITIAQENHLISLYVPD